jgi:hypothetical protein
MTDEARFAEYWAFLDRVSELARLRNETQGDIFSKPVREAAERVARAEAQATHMYWSLVATIPAKKLKALFTAANFERYGG